MEIITNQNMNISSIRYKIKRIKYQYQREIFDPFYSEQKFSIIKTYFKFTLSIVIAISLILFMIDIILEISVKDIITEAHGIVFDLIIFGIFFYYFDQYSKRKEKIITLYEEISDFNDWSETEGILRKKGNLIRLINLKSPLYFTDKNFNQLLLINKKLKDSIFEGCSFIESRWKNIFFKNSNFRFSKFNKSEFKNCNFYSANFSGGEFQNVVFRNCYFKFSAFGSCNFRNAVFDNCNMEGIYLSGSKLNHAKFKNCNLKGAQINQADMSNSSGLKISDYLEMEDISNAKLPKGFKEKIQKIDRRLLKLSRYQISML